MKFLGSQSRKFRFCRARSGVHATTRGMDRGFFITLNAVRRQLAAMPSELCLLRFIHAHTRQAFPAQPQWTGWPLSRGGVVRFLRRSNREGFDVYLRPYAEKQYAGYILLDLDRAAPDVRPRMRAQGPPSLRRPPDQPGASPGLGAGQPNSTRSRPGDPHRQAPGPRLWCRSGQHRLGPLGKAGRFHQSQTHAPPAQRLRPWVRPLYAQAQLAPNANALLTTAARSLLPSAPDCLDRHPEAAPLTSDCHPAVTPAAARDVYCRFLYRLRIPQRFPQTDWSVADL
jgi:hypothetical protein